MCNLSGTKSITICRCDYRSKEEYKAAIKEANTNYSYCVNVDYGNGRRGWKYFKTLQDMIEWKGQK